MAFNGSFGVGENEDEEEINLKDLVKMRENESNIEDTQRYEDIETVPHNNNIFNSISTTEIENNNENKLEYFQMQLIQEKINYSLLSLFSIIYNRINSYKIFFIYKLKNILNQKYSKLVKAEIIYMNFKTKIDHLFFLFQFLNSSKLQKSFNKIKNYSYLKKHQQAQEQLIKKEKENKIQISNNRLNALGSNLNEAKSKINILNNLQKKVNNENKELKNKISQLNEKINQLVKIGNSLKENISNKKNITNNAINKNQESIIQNLQNLIEQKESEKERAMIDVDNFYRCMDVVLSQYESISETILSNCNNINTNK